MMLLAKKITEGAALASVNSPLTPIVIGVLSALVFILLAMLVANMIKFDPGTNPKDKQKRRLWFWILGVLATVVSAVLIYVVFPPICSVTEFQKLGVEDGVLKTFRENLHTYNMWSAISLAGTFVLYVLLGFILSKLFKTKKIGNWF